MKNADVEWSLIFNTAQEVRCVLNVIAKKYGKICFDILLAMRPYIVYHSVSHNTECLQNMTCPFCLLCGITSPNGLLFLWAMWPYLHIIVCLFFGLSDYTWRYGLPFLWAMWLYLEIWFAQSVDHVTLPGDMVCPFYQPCGGMKDDWGNISFLLPRLPLYLSCLQYLSDFCSPHQYNLENSR